MLSEQLKIIRKANGFTQLELSKVIGIERSTYASYETGRNRPDVSVLNKIARAYNVTVDYIISIDEQKPQFSDVVKQYNDEPKLLSELSAEEREIIAKLRIDPQKAEDVNEILFGEKK